MNQSTRRARSFINHRRVLEGFCASLLALACGSGAGDDADGAAADAPAVEEDVIIEPLPPPARDVTPSPAAAEDVGQEQPPPLGEAPAEVPVEQPEPARQCDLAVSFDELYTRIDDDLRAEGDDGPFLRYVSLGNRLNQGICPEDLASDRFALIKALNSLSTQVSIAQPEAMDADATLYRIDLRDLGWDQPTVVDGVAFADKWEAIIAAAPSAIEFEGGEADQAKLSANTTVPLLFADALIDAAMVGNLYYALIEVGESEDELLAQLGIDEEDVDLRVGTGSSRLSRQDAVAERLEVGNFQGYYWARYDIAADTGGQSIFANPIDFAADSIASVFTLQNGLLGYALFDGAGVRQVDTDVIVDQFQRDSRVRNSVSCSQCHAAGLNPMTDEVRAYADDNRRDFDADTLGEIEDTFLPQAEIDELIRQDSEIYQAALARAGIDGAVGDPVSAVYVRFDGDVTLSAAAGELGITPAELSDELGLLSSQADASLSVLRTQNLQREQFEAAYLPALCVLQLASDNRPLAADCAAVGL
jgi:hypothetical protein